MQDTPHPLHPSVLLDAKDGGLSVQSRLDAASRRYDVADARDRAAGVRDEAGAARDLEMTQRERAGRQRVDDTEFRLHAAADRAASAIDREGAAEERRQARNDLAALALEVQSAATDTMTGARSRTSGLREFDLEVGRCRRTGSRLVVAYVDVVGLKACNDTHGHAAGDALLARVVKLIRHHLRPYDLIVRLGGDEFLCAMSNVGLAEARRRLDQISAALARSTGGGAIGVGYAELSPEESSEDLIARADSQLLRGRRATS